MDSVQATSARMWREGLRSAVTTNYVIPRLRTKFGERSFSCASPVAWKALPADLREQTVSSTFNKQLKILFFKSTFIIFSLLL
jgi:hypothetical protein